MANTDHRVCCPTLTAALDSHDAGNTQLAEQLINKARAFGTPHEQDLVQRYDDLMALNAALDSLQH